MPTYSGTILDATSETPLPKATVAIYVPGMPPQLQAADNSGQFEIATRSAASSITVSHAGYKQNTWPAFEQIHRYELERDIKELPPVVITSHKKKWLAWAILAGLLLMIKKRR